MMRRADGRVGTLGAAAALVAALLAQACPRPAAVRPEGREPDLRVGLVVGAERAQVVGQGGMAVVQRGEVLARVPGGDTLTVTPEGRAVLVAGRTTSGRYERVAFVSLDEQRFVAVNGTAYRGIIEAFVAGSGVTVVNELPLEQYLMGVVNAEMGRRSREERAALEAQAIVARTYALKNRGRFAVDGYDLRSSVVDQAYGGVPAETDLGREAIRATAGLVLLHGGQPIAPFFHSTCGGTTAAPEEAFRSVRAEPYLRPVSDARDGGSYCDISPRYRWTVEWDGATLRRILGRTVPANLGIDAGMIDQLRDLRVHRSGPSGRVAEVRVTVARGEIPVFGPDVRSVLETPEGRPLGSSAIRLDVVRDGDTVQRVTAHGAGWGHGVGMCQWGAVGRARAGQHADAILTTYFPGTRIERWY